jgi:hypothetical protein
VRWGELFDFGFVVVFGGMLFRGLGLGSTSTDLLRYIMICLCLIDYPVTMVISRCLTDVLWSSMLCLCRPLRPQVNDGLNASEFHLSPDKHDNNMEAVSHLWGVNHCQNENELTIVSGDHGHSQESHY